MIFNDWDSYTVMFRCPLPTVPPSIVDNGLQPGVETLTCPFQLLLLQFHEYCSNRFLQRCNIGMPGLFGISSSNARNVVVQRVQVGLEAFEKLH
jgi:hypothetical protein